ASRWSTRDIKFQAPGGSLRTRFTGLAPRSRLLRGAAAPWSAYRAHWGTRFRHRACRQDRDGYLHRAAGHGIPANADRTRRQSRQRSSYGDHTIAARNRAAPGNLVYCRGPGDGRSLDFVVAVSSREFLSARTLLVAVGDRRIAVRGLLLGSRRSGFASDRPGSGADFSHLRDRRHVRGCRRAQRLSPTDPARLSAFGELTGGWPLHCRANH